MKILESTGFDVVLIITSPTVKPKTLFSFNPAEASMKNICWVEYIFET